MDFIAALNNASCNFNGIINHTELTVGVEYIIKRMYMAKTVYGIRMVAIITDEEKALFLPARYGATELDVKKYEPSSLALIKQGEATVHAKVTPLLIFKSTATRKEEVSSVISK